MNQLSQLLGQEKADELLQKTITLFGPNASNTATAVVLVALQDIYNKLEKLEIRKQVKASDLTPKEQEEVEELEKKD